MTKKKNKEINFQERINDGLATLFIGLLLFFVLSVTIKVIYFALSVYRSIFIVVFAITGIIIALYFLGTIGRFIYEMFWGST